MVFEIQVRTILQDAWAVIEHYLAYKGVNSIPDESRADFSALVGLFHLADRTFQQLRQSSVQQDVDAATEVAEATAEARINISATATVDIGINRSTVKALLRSLYPDRKPSDDSDREHVEQRDSGPADRDRCGSEFDVDEHRTAGLPKLSDHRRMAQPENTGKLGRPADTR